MINVIIICNKVSKVRDMISDRIKLETMKELPKFR